MKTLTVQIPLTDEEAAILMTKFLVSELEGRCVRECLHVLAALENEIREQIPLIQPEDERFEHSL